MPDAQTIAILFFIALLVAIFVAVKVYRWSRFNIFGQDIPAIISSVSIERDMSGKHVQHIEARWTNPNTNKPYVFRSSNSGRYLYHQGEVIFVHIDPKNPERYKMKLQLI